ncbi:MAG: IS21-like element helper ATPase IstB [Deltaproteobacteria bacterium]|nr:IS21-like element helper ATPase IstB [Deltaproteobacteria bacterium]
MPPRELSRDLVRVLKTLKLGKVLPALPERLRQARERGMDPEDLLLLLLSDEVQRRDCNRLASRAQRAQLAPSMVFDEWDAGAKITYDRQLLDQLRLLQFLERHHHVLIMGPVGVGKTMLAHALGHEAIRRGHGVHCESAEKLFRRLRAARLDDTHAAELRRLATVDLLIVDDFGLRAMNALETADIYELVTARHQNASMVLTSNRDPSEWLGILADPLLAQALVDRFTNNAYDLVIEGESYRKNQKPRSQAG